MSGNDGQYKYFQVFFNTATIEEHCPSHGKMKTKTKKIPFHASVQHVCNTEMTLQCKECSMWRLIYAKRKLKAEEKVQLDESLNDMLFSCGAQLQDAYIHPNLKGVVFVQNYHANENIAF